jgi:aminopeptidase N
MCIRKATLILCSLLLFASAYAQDSPMTPAEFHEQEWQSRVRHFQLLGELEENRREQQEEFDVFFYRLDLDATDISGEIIRGRASTFATSLVNGFDAVLLDFSNEMEVDSVTSGGEVVGYEHNDDSLLVYLNRTYNLGEEFEVTVSYHGHPGLSYFGYVFWWDTHNGFPIMQTLSEPWGAREWWPCKDMPSDKADSADINYTVRDDMIAASNGLLAEVIDNGNGTKTYRWQERYPITTYLVSLAATNYEIISDWYLTLQGDSMPVTHYVYPEHYDDAREDLSITPEAISFYASRFMEYPFTEEKYGHAIFEWGGAMEHQTCTSYGSGLIWGNHWYDWIVVHELAHQWWGDMLTCDTWPDIWLNEGFASYCEALWAEHLGGFDAYHDYMIYDLTVGDPSGPIYDPDPLFGGNTVYHKGAWVLHMLRHVMGDEPFFEGWINYGTRFAYRSATTAEYMAVMEEHYPTGDLSWYFDPWLWGVNRPRYEYSYMHEDLGGGEYEIFIHIDQVQTSPTPFFTMPIDIEVNGGSEDTIVTVWNDTLVGDWRLPLSYQPIGIQLDPDTWILKYTRTAGYSLNIVTTSLPEGTVGEPYTELVEARGGNPPYGWQISQGQLPAGLSLDPSTGEICGTPTREEIAYFTIEVTDQNPLTDDQRFVVVINPSPSRLEIVMEPNDPPIVIPPEGGSFTFNVTLTNNTGQHQVVDVWTMAEVPGMGHYGPLKLNRDLRLRPYQSGGRENIRQNVPGAAPAGEYVYIAYVGDYDPGVKIDSSYFNFTKSGEVRGDLAEWGRPGELLLEDMGASTPTEFGLAQNYPNPFNASTEIGFSLKEPGHVTLKVYNLQGQEVKTLIEEERSSGEHSVTWRGEDNSKREVSSGIYFYRLTCGEEYSDVKRMVLLR